jgi:predicted DNA repair protein MutK
MPAMAGASLLTLLDDIATILDDVAILTKISAKSAAGALDDVAVLAKVAARKTAGVLGDDLALNAEQVIGVKADRELPVVWGVFKGSLRNKLILVPAAMALSALAPWAVTPLLMAGGLFLAYEGFEKVWHKLAHRDGEEQDRRAQLARALVDPNLDLAALEKDRIRGAIRTDFILSAEIIAITLGLVATAPFGTRLAVLAGIAALMTVGVYGIVAGIVKLDDAGLYLCRRSGDGVWARCQRTLGFGILSAAPWLMTGLSIAGTAAMFLVGGGILVHGIPAIERMSAALAAWGGAMLVPLTQPLVNALVGVVAGAFTVAIVSLIKRARRSGNSSGAGR